MPKQLRSEPLYSDIWNHIKVKGTCKIAANAVLHARIIHAVINKKYYDSAYKLEMAENKKISKLFYKKEINCISFRLEIRNDLKNYTTEDI
jgi:hypothetical protein